MTMSRDDHTDVDSRRALVESIHASSTLLVFAVAGGGNAAITDLLDVPGASRTVLEVRVPYAESALREFSANDAGAVSQAMAEAMAAACLDRARDLAPPGEPVIGVACTAALASDRPKRGDHRAHIVVAGPAGCDHSLITLEKGRDDRRGEDRIVADAVLQAIATSCGIEVS